MLSRVAPIALLASLAAACGAASSTGEPVVVLPGSEDPPVAVPASATASAAPAASTKPAAIPWVTSEDVARARAKARSLPIVVFLFAEWDASAVRMDRTTWIDPRLQERARNFVALRLDITSADASAQAVADRFNLQTVPSIVILDDAGHEAARLDGLTTADAILAALDRVPVGD